MHLLAYVENRASAGAVEGVDRFDQADGADADEVVLVAGQGVVLFCDVGHKAQVVAG